MAKIQDTYKRLNVEKLAIGYKSKKEENVIASDINFSLNPGELIGLIGANGIGKSTLIRTLCKIQAPLSGDIHLKDLKISEYSFENFARVLSVVLTEAPAAKNLTALELIALGRQPYTNWLGSLTQNDKEKIKEAIHLTEIDDLVHKKCYELSDGQLQRVLIARALAQDTPFIILDEPTTHLDLYHRVAILKLLQRLTQKTQKAVLFSTHDVELALQICDKMLIMSTEQTYFDSPKKLIKKGAFNSLFPKDLLEFNPDEGSFKIKN